MGAMEAMTILLEGDGLYEGVDRSRLREDIAGVTVAGIRNGMTSGKPAVTLRIDLADGTTVLARTSLALLLSAADGLRSRHGDPRIPDDLRPGNGPTLTEVLVATDAVLQMGGPDPAKAGEVFLAMVPEDLGVEDLAKASHAVGHALAHLVRAGASSVEDAVASAFEQGVVNALAWRDQQRPDDDQDDV